MASYNLVVYSVEGWSGEGRGSIENQNKVSYEHFDTFVVFVD